MTVESTPAIDETRQWVDSHRVNGLVRPSLLVRFATDTNFKQGSDKAIMNLGLPGQRVPHVQQWQVTEQADQVVQQATLTCLNCMLVSETETTIAGGSSLSGNIHSPHFASQWTNSPKGGDAGQTLQHNGDYAIDNPASPWGGHALPSPPDLVWPGSTELIYNEGDVAFRLYQMDAFNITSAAGFPNPAIPNDDDGEDLAGLPSAYWPISNTGVGAYYVLVDNEIVKVVNLSGTTFYVPPGGRGIAGTAIVPHAAGAPVKLLNYGPYTGESVGMGWLSVDDYRPQTSIARPGTCFSIYEGYGVFSGPMKHDPDPSRNYTFSGYWFVTGSEPSLQSDGTPMITLTVSSAGHMVEAQKVNTMMLARMGTIEKDLDNAIWGGDNLPRKVPAPYEGWNAWDPSEMNAYPLTISVEYAQNKDFLEHYQSSKQGIDCLICRQDVVNWLQQHGYSTNVAGVFGIKVEPQLTFAENRVVGMHIYKESIRVNRDEGGPLKTYIALMATLALWSWDHPALSTELSQYFTKIPNKLYHALTNIHSGLCFNGQLSIDVDAKDPDNVGVSDATYPWFAPSYLDVFVVNTTTELFCPFKSQYDQVPFTQPMQDIADVNGASFWIDRCGYPVFVPMFFSFRPTGNGFKSYAAFANRDTSQLYPKTKGEWFLAYGGSISEYSSSLQTDQIFTVATCSGQIPFDGSTIQVLGGGTGISSGKRIMYGPVNGNKDGLAMTSGVTQATTVDMSNVMLGLSWKTNPAYWGIKQLIDPSQNTAGKNFVLNGKPPIYDGQRRLSDDSKGYGQNSRDHPGYVTMVQQTVNFFLLRQYVTAIDDDGLLILQLGEDGKWGRKTTIGVIALQNFLKTHGFSAISANGIYDVLTAKAVNGYLDANAYYIQTDVFWYAFNWQSWDEYVAAVTGVPVLFNANDTLSPGTYAVDDHATQAQVADWANKKFSQPLVNVANRTVDNSINKATVRSVTCNLADPRIQPGDTVWLNIPGYLGTQTTPPYTNGMYVLQTSRSMDVVQGSYTMTLSGSRYVADHNSLFTTAPVNDAFNSLTGPGAG